MQKTSWFLGILLLLALIMGIVTVTNSPKEAPQRTIPVGAILPLTGAVASIGETWKEGLAWRLTNATTTEGRIVLNIQDSHSDTKDAISAFEQVRVQHQAKIIFTLPSASALALKPLAEQTRTLLWADVAHPAMTEASNFILRHSNVTSKDAPLMAAAFVEHGATSAAIFYEKSDFAQSYADALAGLTRDKQFRLQQYVIDNKATDFRSSIVKAKAEHVDAFLFVSTGPAAGILVKQARELGFTGKLYSANTFVLTPQAQAIAGAYAKGMYYQTYAGNEAFRQAFLKKFNKEPALLSFIAYTDGEILVHAINATHSTDPRTLANYIKSLRTFTGTFETVEIHPSGDMIIPTILKVWE